MYINNQKAIELFEFYLDNYFFLRSVLSKK